MNRNAAYLYEVDGLTVWERLRVIRGFLKDRKQALALAELAQEEFEHNKSTMDLKSFTFRRLEIEHNGTIELIQDTKDEIKFLTELEEKLAAEAELTRVDGKSDREMYELNFFNEKIERNLLQARAEIVATGHIRPETMKILLREPEALSKAIQLQLLPEQAENYIQPPLLENK